MRTPPIHWHVSQELHRKIKHGLKIMVANSYYHWRSPTVANQAHYPERLPMGVNADKLYLNPSNKKPYIKRQFIAFLLLQQIKQFAKFERTSNPLKLFFIKTKLLPCKNNLLQFRRQKTCSLVQFRGVKTYRLLQFGFIIY